MKKNRLGVGIVVIVLMTLIAGFGTLIRFGIDYLWFKEMGYTSVFFTQLFTQLKIGVPTFVILTILTFLYLKSLKKAYYKKVKIDGYTAAEEKALNRIVLGLSAIFGLLVTLSTVTKLWFQILQYQNSTSFGLADPIFNRDISFYVFKMEFLAQLNQIALGLVVAFFVVTLLFYFILLGMRKPKMFDEEEPQPFTQEDDGTRRFTGNFDNFGPFGDMFGQVINGKFGNRKPKKQFDKNNFNQLLSIASKQISIMGVVFFLMIGTNLLIKQFSLLYSQTGLLYGAGFTDINVTLLIYRLLMGLSVLAAIFFVMGLKNRNYKKMLMIPALMIVISIGGTAVAGLVQYAIVSPDEINKESKYLENNIAFTQRAYDLQDIEIKEFPATNTLTKDDILNNMGTISNIRINDFSPVEQFYNQTQSIRSYYTFNNVDVDRYMVNGEYTQTFLSAREIDEAKIGEQWLTKHIKYTHGYGITLSRVDKVTASGQPDMLIDSIPPVSDVNEIQIARPEIYFGEKTNNYIITNTTEKEFDYPSGTKNKYATYEGNAGIKLNLMNRILFAIREQNLKILVSGNIDNNSKIIINRNIKNRVQKIAPFLAYDKDPYIVTVDGKLYWILDAYTASSYYPYSEPFSDESRANYIRNSVKVVIDAYNGDANFYLVDDEDPIANTLAKIYPNLFKNFDQMPESLQSHIRYPNFLFNIQANVYKKYHMSDVNVFYQSEDLWAIANEVFGTEETPMEPTYYVMKIPGEDKVEFINSIPYTPNGKQNMTGLLMARNDGEKYGDLILYQLPKDRVIYGPRQIEAQIDQDTTISKEFSLWSTAGSTYSRGNMFVIPIENSIMYVEPVYLEASNNSLPEVKRVIVYYGDRIAYEPTLAQALNNMFGEGAGAPLSSNTPSTDGEEIGSDINTNELSNADIAIYANDAFNKALNAQKNGDWAAYGEYLKELEKYLTLLNPTGATAEKPEQNASTVD
ncbi:MAG: UPF0182 family protein [Anaerovorax sp.]|nr:UPF0182 family protein [Anaerovorax sp.]